MKEQGYALWSGPSVKVEMSTFTCCHCNRIVHMKPKCPVDELGGFCRRCMKMTCPSCNQTGNCTPFEKWLEKMEARDRSRRSMGI